MLSDREGMEEIKQEIMKILKECGINSAVQFEATDGEEGNVLYERLKAGVVEVFDPDDDEMGEILDEVLESMSYM